jgi:integrase
MSRHAKGPRLYLRQGRIDRRTGAQLPSRYFIRDGQKEVGTGCGPDGLREAERALAAYIASKYVTPPTAADRRRDPDQVLVAEVLALYAHERAPELAGDAVSIAGFISHLLGFWFEKTLGDVRRSTCREYVAHRTAQTVRRAGLETGRKVSDQTARRELEVLSASIGYWHGEDKLSSRPEVWLPPKPPSPRDALTRSQVAALLLAARGRRRAPNGSWSLLPGSSRANRAHMARFVLIALYTGSRSAVVTSLLWRESPAQAWVDLERGMVYRRGRAERDHKTKRRPVVKLSPRLLSHMRRWRRIDEAQEIAWREEDARLGPGRPVRLLNAVVHHGGLPVAKVKKGFSGCVRDAGLPHEVTAHWLRHTAATLLMEAGVDPWLAASYIGMSIATLEKHYAHHRPDFQAEARGAL